MAIIKITKTAVTETVSSETTATETVTTTTKETTTTQTIMGSPTTTETTTTDTTITTASNGNGRGGEEDGSNVVAARDTVRTVRVRQTRRQRPTVEYMLDFVPDDDFGPISDSGSETAGAERGAN
ncbi:hypothetical protein Purlil1_1392 [Purpureocillium lilacinum]|uniref:Uncharacterized protein n=1 Tax=Purpureocillium lilacinum TaxID=33203 RepID=A0ABR0CDA6_PURLI|nr:hypothetical protein Purlil1_1392 [Purpureocillium lilacinum]